jgi:hypothetical protein
VNSFFKLDIKSSLADLETTTRDFCATPWNQTLERLAPSEVEYANTYCWYAIYQWNMLKEGYGFEDDKIEVSKMETVNDVELSWTIGAMLSHVAQIEIDDDNSWETNALIGLVLLCIGAILPLYLWLRRRKKGPRRFAGR